MLSEPVTDCLGDAPFAWRDLLSWHVRQTARDRLRPESHSYHHPYLDFGSAGEALGDGMAMMLCSPLEIAMTWLCSMVAVRSRER